MDTVQSPESPEAHHRRRVALLGRIDRALDPHVTAEYVTLRWLSVWDTEQISALATMVERCQRHAFLEGAEIGRREMAEEYAERAQGL
ncbi:MAG TPA: hypothetical protein VIP77_22450 [Jiangellaceae bacterium]